MTRKNPKKARVKRLNPRNLDSNALRSVMGGAVNVNAADGTVQELVARSPSAPKRLVVDGPYT